jgi:hypothetical protein
MSGGCRAAKVLAKEADMQHHHNKLLCKITDGFAIDLDSHVALAVSWDSVDNVTALLVMQTMQGRC